MYLYSRESGVPDLGLFQSHPTHMYLYVPHAPLHVSKVLKKAGGEESVLRKNFLSPGGTRVAGPKWRPPGEGWCFWEPRKRGPDSWAASSSYLELPRPLVHS